MHQIWWYCTLRLHSLTSSDRNLMYNRLGNMPWCWHTWSNVALDILVQFYPFEYTSIWIMTLSNDKYLCNEVLVDHRLKSFFSRAKWKHFQKVKKHANTVKNFDNTIIRDDKIYFFKNEANFDAWLAKLNMQNDFVIALLQSIKSQIYISDYHWIKDECSTLIYLKKAWIFLNDSKNFANTNVFDVFSFIIESIFSKRLSKETTNVYNTFFVMLKIKKSKIVFVCWRIKNQNLFFFENEIDSINKKNIEFFNDQIVRVVNEFHFNHTINFCLNESCFSKLFIMKLCKAFCELNTVWKKNKWMNMLKWKYQEQTRQLIND